MPNRAGLVWIGLAIAGCSRPADDRPGATSDSQQRRPSGIVVTETGIGPLRAGMTVAQGEAALRTSLGAPPGQDSANCRMVQWVGGPPGLRVMVENNRIVRVDVDSGALTTAAGARIGDTEERVKGLYAGRLVVRPHKYSGGRYLVVMPAAAADSAFRLIFETDGKRVTRYRAGHRPQVEYVEGCG
jgi:hypothetical protein